MPTLPKPSQNEDEYFLKLDAELIKEMRARLDRERAEAERKSHFMKCPKCGASLHEADFEHIKIDVCPECGGVWLDSGELDMLRQVKEHRFGRFILDLMKGLPGR